MTATKKGFIFYFDNYPILSTLPMEQRGLLFSVLIIYADRVWRDTSVSLEEVMESFPQLARETRVACSFMGAAIQRDTLAWLDKRDYRLKKKQEREVSSTETEQRTREDMERVRRLLEKMNADG